MKIFLKNKNRFETFVVLLSIYTLLVTPLARATELIITDNGGGSDNQVELTNETQTEVTQSNEADANNSVESNANTGGNTASENTNGNTSIQTGDVNSQSTIDNQANTSVADMSECCQSDANATISGNASDSMNNIDLEEKSSNTVVVTQNATITSSIKGYTNTGKNEAIDNAGGDTTINTGDIKVNSQIINGPINIASVKSSIGLGTVSAKIASNGSGSTNSLSAKIVTDPNIFINNYSDINNFTSWDANTGGNSANGNSGGDVSIATGNIDLEIFIKNLVNISRVEISCCDIYDPGTPPPGGDGGGGGNGGDSNNGSSSSSGSSGSSAPAGSEAGMGGSGILGLSDTSSGQFQSLMFMIGLVMAGLGIKFVGETMDLNLKKRVD